MRHPAQRMGLSATPFQVFLPAARNPLIDVYRLASERGENSIDTLHREADPAIEFAAEAVLHTLNIVRREPRRRDDPQHGSSGRLLRELKLADAKKCVVVHVQGGPGNRRAVVAISTSWMRCP